MPQKFINLINWAKIKLVVFYSNLQISDIGRVRGMITKIVIVPVRYCVNSAMQSIHLHNRRNSDALVRLHSRPTNARNTQFLHRIRDE